MSITHDQRYDLRCGAIGLALFLAVWELCGRFESFTGIVLPWVSALPPPTSVLGEWSALLLDPGYWTSWVLSFRRVLTGFLAAMAIGIPLGLAMAVSRSFRGLSFPPFEMLRPVPPLAWVPASILFWPTQELSIAFVTFLGAFTTVVINVLGGARAVDQRYIQAAQAMGSSDWDIFRRVILPAVVPSIVVGAVVGMGITWEVVVAAEMLAGGGSKVGGTGGGLGFFIWNSYVGGSFERIVIGMISIGLAGYLSSVALREIGERCTPWLRRR